MRLPIIAVGMLTLPLMACSPPAQREVAAPEAGGTDAPATVSEAPAVRAPVGANASANLVNAQGDPKGVVTFRQGPTGVLIRIEASGLTPGWHGLHLHQVGQCEGPKFDGAGSHVQHSAATASHGLLNSGGPDAGDLPNLHVDAQGRGFAEVFTTTARLGRPGQGEILLDANGSAILIHAMADDHAAQPIGGSGERVACGVIAAG